MQQVMTGEAPKPMGNRDPHMAPHGLFRCRGSDSWISIVVGDEEEWRAVCRVMARSELADDARFRTLARRKANEDELESLITGWTETLTADEAAGLLQAEGGPPPAPARGPACPRLRSGQAAQEDLRCEAREKSTSAAVLRQYVGARRLSATKHPSAPRAGPPAFRAGMRLFQQLARGG